MNNFTDILDAHERQLPGNRTLFENLSEYYHHILIVRDKELLDLRYEQPYVGRQCLIKNIETNLSFTSYVHFNNHRQGLLHSFLRHFSQWVIYCPSLVDLLRDDLTTLAQEVEREVLDKQILDNRINELMLNDEFKTSLMKIQKVLCSYIERNIGNYIGRRINENRRIQYLFRTQFDAEVLVIAFSEELYPMLHNKIDNRRLRRIITLFFSTEITVHQI